VASPCWALAAPGSNLTALAEGLSLPAPARIGCWQHWNRRATFSKAGGEWLIGVRAFRVGSAFRDHRNLVRKRIRVSSD
jgi:hypothetical protein